MLILCLLVAIPAIWAFLMILLGFGSKQWPRVHGSVISYTIIETSNIRKFPSLYDNNQYYYSYYPKINYEYYINGKKYCSSTISYDEIFPVGTTNKENIENRFNNLIEDSKVTVYFNPLFPFLSVLQTGMHSVGNYVFIICVCMALLAIIGIFVH